ncbi:MAG: NUDIX hydrolase [Candidatus Micrarchaeia archaeon]
MKKIYYKGNLLTLEEEKIKLKGNKITAVRIKENDAVVILPIFNNRIVIEKQYRPPIKKFIYELPAGHIKGNETPIMAAKRELLEETGFFAKRLRFMFKAYPQPGTTTSMHFFYYAECSKRGEARPEADEDIKIKLMRIDKALKMVRAHLIIDTKTIAALLYYAIFK